jgi:hypothetical protein
MAERLEQRYFIKFCQKLGDNKVEIIRKIQQAFGDDVMGVTQIKEWFNCFKGGRIFRETANEPMSLNKCGHYQGRTPFDRPGSC